MWYASFSPDGTRLAAAGKGEALEKRRFNSTQTPFWKPWGSVTLPGDVVIWDTATGRKILEWPDSGQDLGPGAGMALSPDGQWVARAQKDGGVTVRELSAGRKVWSSPRRPGGVTSLAFSPDGASLASANSEEETVTLGEAATGREVRSLRRHLAGRAELSFGRDGRFLLLGRSGQGAEVWDTTNGREVLCLRRPIAHVALSPDGAQIAAASPEGVITVIKLVENGSAEAAWRLAGNGGTVTELAQSPDGQCLISVVGTERVNSWAVKERQERLALQVPTAEDREHALKIPLAGPFALDSGGRHVCCAMGPLTVWDAATGQEVWTVRKVFDEANGTPIKPAARGDDSIRGVAFAPDGRRLASLDRDGRLSVWGVTNDVDVPVRSLGSFRPVRGEFSTKGDTIAALDDAGGVWRGDLKSGRPLAVAVRVPIVSWVMTRPVFSAGADRIAVVTGEDGSTAEVHDLESQSVLSLPTGGPGNPIASLAFSPEGSRLAAGHWDRSVRLWELPRARQLGSITTENAFVTRLLFSSDGRRLLAATEDGEVMVFTLEALKRARGARFPFGHTGAATGNGHSRLDCLAFSRDGTKVAAAGTNQHLRGRGGLEVWDVDTGQTAYSLPVGAVSAIAFNHDGTRIAIAGDRVRVLDAKTGSQVCLLSPISSQVLRLAFVKDGDQLVMLCENGATIWDASPLDGP